MEAFYQPDDKSKIRSVHVSNGDVVGVAQLTGRKKDGELKQQEDRYYVCTDIALEPGEEGSFLEGVVAAGVAKSDGMLSGSAVIAVVIAKNLKLHHRHLGDCLVAVITHDRPTGGVTCLQLTRDHHLSDPSERRAVEAAGGKIVDVEHTNERGEVIGMVPRFAVGGVMLSRGGGDADCVGMIRTPDPTEAYDLSADLNADRDVYVLVATDGIVQRMGLNFIATLLSNVQSSMTPLKEDQLAQALAQYAADFGSTDDITLLVKKVSRDMDRNIFLEACDGHGGSQAADAFMQAAQETVRPRISMAYEARGMPSTERDPQIAVTKDSPAIRRVAPTLIDEPQQPPAPPAPRREKKDTLKMKAFQGAVERDTVVTPAPIVRIGSGEPAPEKKEKRTEPGIGPARPS